jgi:hypothetical protein
MILVILTILMFIISLTLHKTIAIAIHNQYPDIELASPVYFHNCETSYEYPVERTNVGSTMKIEFIFNSDQDKPRGILVYTIQRKETMRSDHPSSIDDKVIEDALKRMRLLIAWKIEHFRWPRVRIMLVEYDNEPILNEDKLAQLCDKVNNIPSDHNHSKYTWLICDNTTLTITHKVMRKEGFELKMIISGELIDRGIRPIWIEPEFRLILRQTLLRSERRVVRRPIWIDSTRQVSSLMVMYPY